MHFIVYRILHSRILVILFSFWIFYKNIDFMSYTIIGQHPFVYSLSSNYINAEEEKLGNAHNKLDKTFAFPEEYTSWLLTILPKMTIAMYAPAVWQGHSSEENMMTVCMSGYYVPHITNTCLWWILKQYEFQTFSSLAKYCEVLFLCIDLLVTAYGLSKGSSFRKSRTNIYVYVTKDDGVDTKIYLTSLSSSPLSSSLW